MKTPLAWLKKYLPFALDVEALSDLLTLSGLEVEKVEDSEDDLILTIALTPDLGHCRSILGIARELAPHLQETIKYPAITLKEDPDNLTSSKISLSNEDFEACPHYNLRILQGIEVGPSPAWLSHFLEQAGYQSINNVVDITNFVMMETGQPLHAFDYDRLKHKHIIIRKSIKEELLETLDGTTRTIPEGTLLIFDGKTPIAIAGVMGGLESGVHSSTHTIVLEAAQFMPSIVRKGAKKLGIRTESSSRFENGIDPAGIKNALNRAASLLIEHAKGRLLKSILEQSLKPYLPRFLNVRLSRINKVLGITLSLSEVETLFTRLSFSFSSDGQETFHVKVPSYRGDLQSEIDLIAEVAKLYGLNNIERRPIRSFHATTPDHPLYLFEKKVQNRLIALGLQQFVTCNLLSPLLASLTADKDPIAVLHAKSVDQSILRSSLLPGLLAVLKENQNHKTFDVQGFEIGKIHFKKKEGYEERLSLGIVMMGSRAPYHFAHKVEPLDFYDLKGVVEGLRKSLLLSDFDFKNKALKTFHPYRQASLSHNEEVFGVMGEVHPEVLEKLAIKGRVLFAEIDLEALLKKVEVLATFTPLSLFPTSERDLTLSLPMQAELKPIFAALANFSSPLLKKTLLLDIYIASSEEKRVTLRFTYQDDHKTLSQEVVEEEHAKIVSLLSTL
ncbi:MAG: phenylalanine--tRNA ligase subunit beta [Verrucomicrobia bacterium]|nr:phenylalanine--tRNA ligase subunit beta [Verrucomicrobiota bacterium]